jgi:hypothetical protein
MDEIDEAELTGAGRRGTVVGGAANGSRRTVQAALLRKCCHELRDTIDPRGLRMRNVTVAGSLDLTGLAVPFALRFEGCDFDTAPVVEGAQLFELALTGCPRLPGLLGNGVRLRRDLDLSRSRIAGAQRRRLQHQGPAGELGRPRRGPARARARPGPGGQLNHPRFLR